ncbi:hypothetical protein GJ496_006220 [Pomphorhynchus laevis]|nr:hypothetical protein GJ496_001078 [Pomphorhynchus laevis]KAI0989995.1 hypothetical protein GJ496_006220 [Pomphorhynchus laevis]
MVCIACVVWPLLLLAWIKLIQPFLIRPIMTAIDFIGIQLGLTKAIKDKSKDSDIEESDNEVKQSTTCDNDNFDIKARSIIDTTETHLLQ